jgi:hypothetical protein
MMMTIDAERNGVVVAYKIRKDGTDVEDIRVFQHHADAKRFVKNTNEEGWMLWQRPIE